MQALHRQLLQVLQNVMNKIGPYQVLNVMNAEKTVYVSLSPSSSPMSMG